MGSAGNQGNLRPFPHYMANDEPGSGPGSEAPSERLVEDDEYLDEDEDYLDPEDIDENEKLYGPVGDPDNVFYDDRQPTPAGVGASSYGSGLSSEARTAGTGQSYKL